MKVYVSSLAFLGQSLEEFVSKAKEESYPIEFSSALPYHPSLIQEFLAYPHPKLAHNYFPAPEDPFVLNLASKVDEIRERSIRHCLTGLELTKKVGAKYFSAHAGFCLDPKPEELGKKIEQSEEPILYELYWNNFSESVNFILEQADKMGVDFYIENNVCAKMNLNVLGQNPLFCSDPEQMIHLMETINHPRFGILLDTAHLKVSSNTLEFDLNAAIQSLQAHIRAIHHSDNDGKFDTNDSLNSNYWFLNFLPLFKNITHVLEVKKLETSAINDQLELLRLHSS